MGKYTGFVPDKNRKEILDFKGVKKGDAVECEIVNSKKQVVGYVSFSDITDNEVIKCVKSGKDYYVECGGIKVKGGEEKWGHYSKVRLFSDELLICAPVKDMDMSGMTIEERL